jgi:hypothetical protein
LGSSQSRRCSQLCLALIGGSSLRVVRGNYGVLTHPLSV